MSKTNNTNTKSNAADDLFASITERLIAAMEDGTDGWKRPWVTIAKSGTPVNIDGRPYRGLNALILPLVAFDKGYQSGVWGTYKAWAAKGGQVRKGEKGTPVVLWKQTNRKDRDEATGEETTRKSLFATTFTVFAAEQVEGSDAIVAKRQRKDDRPEVEVAGELADFFAAVGADVRTGGDRAAFSPSADYIRMPEAKAFKNVNAFYATLGHEHIHWTGHDDRLAREFGKRFGDNAYAVEELVAELGSAFLCAQFGIETETRDDHAAYLRHWVQVLRESPKALVTVASKAQAAVDYLNKLAAPAVIETEAAA